MPARSERASYKSNPIGSASYLRLYPGFDGVATNGLRYGASAEIRQNIMSANSFNASTSQTGSTGSFASGSGYTSAETLFTRRAFTYLGSDQLGIIRIGQDDGVVGLFDATGVFTLGTWNLTGGILDGDTEAVQPNAFLISWAWLSGNGIEYGQQRVSYMSPSFFGFDFAVDFSPSTANSFGNGTTSSPYQTGTCAVESANCDNVTGGADSSRPYNRVSAGVRYQGSFSGLDVKAFGLYTHSAGESITMVPNGGLAAGPGPSPLTASGNTLKYDGQSFFDVARGPGLPGVCGQRQLYRRPVQSFEQWSDPDRRREHRGHADRCRLFEWPLGDRHEHRVRGLAGRAQYTHISQRHEFAFTYMVGYKLAPGINLAAEYLYIQKHQGGFDFYTNGANTTTTRAGNDIHAQGLTFATILSW